MLRSSASEYVPVTMKEIELKDKSERRQQSQSEVGRTMTISRRLVSTMVTRFIRCDISKAQRLRNGYKLDQFRQEKVQ